MALGSHRRCGRFIRVERRCAMPMRSRPVFGVGRYYLALDFLRWRWICLHWRWALALDLGFGVAGGPPMPIIGVGDPLGTYVRTYVRTYLRMYVCMYVCMYACMHVCYVCMYACMYVCMYVRILGAIKQNLITTWPARPSTRPSRIHLVVSSKEAASLQPTHADPRDALAL